LSMVWKVLPHQAENLIETGKKADKKLEDGLIRPLFVLLFVCYCF